MIRERLLDFFNVSEVTSKDMERMTGIDRAVRARRRRVNEDDIEAFNEAFPQFAYWLTTGKTIPEAGHISPEMEKARKANSLKTGKVSAWRQESPVPGMETDEGNDKNKRAGRRSVW